MLNPRAPGDGRAVGSGMCPSLFPLHLTGGPLCNGDQGQPSPQPHEECQWGGPLPAGIRTTRAQGGGRVQGMRKRVPQLKEQWLQFYLIFLLTCKVGGRKTNVRGHHGTGTSGWGELGGGWGAMCTGGRRVQELEWATAWGGLGRGLRSRRLGQSVVGFLWVCQGEIDGGLD